MALGVGTRGVYTIIIYWREKKVERVAQNTFSEIGSNDGVLFRTKLSTAIMWSKNRRLKISSA
jgi:hypothetical protein